jgi:hypothetical protein
MEGQVMRVILRFSVDREKNSALRPGRVRHAANSMLPQIEASRIQIWIQRSHRAQGTTGPENQTTYSFRLRRA